ncbi:MAG: family 20 glycosylhydrolase [Verrucomicrobia bacterium]|nr:family 20 glycosylhydrolase [Verrucomicrobiota bacterium]
MTALLPHPQEIHILPSTFTMGSACRCVVSASAESDALIECLQPALSAFAGECIRFAPALLPGKRGCALAVANRPDAIERLVNDAFTQMKQPVRKLSFCMDGGNVKEPMDGMGKRQAPAEGIQALSEAYVLRISPEGIAIAATDRAGLFYGAQTLCQYLDGKQRSCSCAVIRDFPSLRVRGIHVDMKYAFAKPETLHGLLRRMASLKLNHALFEYEDKFPYQRHAVIVDRERGLTQPQIRQLLRTARQYHVEIIPLVQTLGHLEFALKHDGLAPLRECADAHSMICPQNARALRFVKNLIDEILDLHADAKFLHVGGDETYLLGCCPKCKAAAAKKGLVGLYLEHIAKVCCHLLKREVRPILWDDVLRREPGLQQRLPRQTILAYWDYGTVREHHGPREIPAALKTFHRCASKRPEEWPDTLSMYPHFDSYRRAGFDVIGIPCYTGGTLVPNEETTLRNLSTWAEKTHSGGGLGVINSGWASFLLHPDATWLDIAQTAEQTWWWPSINRLHFDARFGQTFFGVSSPEIAEAIHAISVGVCLPVKEKIGRPLSLLTFAYMEVVIHFEGDLKLRQRLGGSIMQGPMDAHNHLLRKLELVESEQLGGEVLRQLDECEPILESAARRLRAVKPLVKRNRGVVDLLLTLAELKRMRCKHVRFFLDTFAQRRAPAPHATRRQAALLLSRERKLRAVFHRLHAAKVCALDARLITRRMFDGETRFLENLARGKRIQPSYRNEFHFDSRRARWFTRRVRTPSR